MPLAAEPIRQPQRCTWEVEEGTNFVSLLCNQPAIVVISRREQGTLALCKKHMNNPDVYRDVVQYNWVWRVVLSV